MNLIRTSSLIVVFCVLLLSLPMNSVAQTTMIGPDLDSLDTQIQTEMQEGRIPSLQAGIFVNDSLVWAKGYGDQPGLNMVYMIGSISKTFTATAFLQLYEQGLVNLDEDVSNYLPFDVRNPNDPSSLITVRKILTHTAGLQRDYYFGVSWADNMLIEWLNTYYGSNYTYEGPPPPLGEVINNTNINDPDLWLSTSAGGYSYSNTGFLFLSFLLEKITNQSFYDYIRENILTPLDMNDTGFLVSEFGDNHVIPYGTLSNGTVIAIPHYDLYAYGAAFVRTTVLDLSKYLIAHMNGGISNGVRILNASSVALMHSEELGWSGGERQGHGGTVYGFNSKMYYSLYEGSKYGAILLMNREDTISSDFDFQGAQRDILNMLLREGLDMVNGTITTPTDTGADPSLDILMIGGIAAGGLAVVVVIVLIAKRKT